MRSTIAQKISQIETSLEANLSITYEDANRTINEIYKSKTAGILSKVPRSHTVLLVVIESLFLAKRAAQLDFVTLLTEYNKRATSMMIEKVRMGDIMDMVETLANFSILTVIQKGGKKLIGLAVEIEELSEALSQTVKD